MKHVLILDLSLNGHHSIYLEHIASTYLDLGYYVTITYHYICKNYPIIEKLRVKYRENLNYEIVNQGDWKSVIRSSGGNFGSDMANWFIFRKKFLKINAQKKVDYVFIPYIDYCLNTLGLFGSPFGSVTWGGICMQASVHHSEYPFLKSNTKLNSIKKIIFLKLLKNKNLSVLFTIDELLIEYINKKEIAISKKIMYLADPVIEFKSNHTQASARKKLNIPLNAVIILVYGAINTRKGLDLILNALCQPSISNNIHIFIVGEQEDSIVRLLKSSEAGMLSSNGRIHVINQFVDDYTQEMVFAATDIVWLGYRNHFSMSGVLVLAAIAKKVVISSNEGLIGWQTREKKLGITVDINNIDEINEALVNLANKENRKYYQSSDDNIFQNHTWDNAVKTILTTKEFF